MDQDRQSPELIRKKIELQFGFYVHLAVYIIVNALLIFLDLKKPGNIWFIYPLLGWGIGIAIHGLSAFILPKMIEKEIGKITSPKEEKSAI